VSAELGAAMRVSDRTVQGRMGDAAILRERFPATLAAWRAGRIDAGHVSVILDAVTTVSAVAAADADIEPTTHAVPLTNVYREDVVRPGLSHEAALAGAPAVEDDRFRVPQILGEEQ
jgi:aspartyl-tRNA(Asn)/glutamyl-tRNA(Gln) amidotransferase subunit C